MINKHKNPMKNVNWTVVRLLEKKSYKFDSEKHFNPETYCKNIDIKLQKYKSSRHQKYIANFHIVFVTRGRCQILFKEVRDLLNQFIREETESHENWSIYACEVMNNHIHLFVSLDNTTHPYQYVGIVRNQVANKIKICFPILEKALGKQIFSRSFYWGTIGNVTGLGLLNYIHKQWEGQKATDYFKIKKYLESKNRKLTDFL